MFSERITVVGRVQGVGFRAHVVRAAGAYRVTGSVRNLPAAGVEIIAQHPDGHVLYEGFLRQVAEGPGKVDLLWCQGFKGEVFEAFQIAYGPP
ncbi:MAG: acylphosphatase [Fimbriimonadales bacterium]